MNAARRPGLLAAVLLSVAALAAPARRNDEADLRVALERGNTPAAPNGRVSHGQVKSSGGRPAAPQRLGNRQPSTTHCGRTFRTPTSHVRRATSPRFVSPPRVYADVGR